MVKQMAEACISFGNVSHPQRNEAYYQRALRLLRRATAVEGYRVDVHLQQYVHSLSYSGHIIEHYTLSFLDENIRYIE